MPELVIENIRRQIGSLEILKGISLSLRPGEIVALLGHSGSGKTTLLRSVAGLDVPSTGRIQLRDKTVFDDNRGINLPPEHRGLSLVFQSYALWPNKTVDQNVGYGLRLRGASAAETATKVSALLERLGLASLGKRYPHQLSGGQQQRVALARALVYQPPVLLLDEPLSNLDAKLREEARSWLRELIVQANISALYVTHDQIEAMAVADRIMLLRGGSVEQEGTPQEIYERPNSLDAAEFMGSNNRFPVSIISVDNGVASFRLGGADLRGALRGAKAAGEKATALVRIERVRIADGPGANRMQCELNGTLYLGERREYMLTVDGTRFRAWGQVDRAPGPCWVDISPEDLWLF
ncbi:Fe(3+) ions import ATP-binding protein FbpC [Hyphomicrobiales bacterium]|nr:Fe(3+) ions import ATP-binding protein FbpC [Hyphomicrobiales bacterium]CAH1695444.1 Fe(3+) ions import ATP-binding protein FbpC [Hyphomicrobiales bacterium]